MSTAGSQQKFSEDILNQFIPQLLETLPMDKAIFLGKLRASGLLSGDLKADLKSMSTSEDKADYFLDVVIIPTLPDDTTNLDKLLDVMEAYNDDNVKQLSGEIRAKCYTD